MESIKLTHRPPHTDIQHGGHKKRWHPGQKILHRGHVFFLANSAGVPLKDRYAARFLSEQGPFLFLLSRIQLNGLDMELDSALAYF